MAKCPFAWSWFGGLVMLAATALAGQAASALTVHVSPQGDDAAAGSQQQPLRTLAAAQQRVRQQRAEQPARSVEVVLHDGVYRITEPLRFTAEDGAAEGHTVRWRAAAGARPRISGGRPITGWQRQPDGSFTTTLDAVARGEWKFRELYVNGQRRSRARYPSTGYARVKQVGQDRRTSFIFHPQDVPESLAGNLAGSGLELVFFHDWSSSRTPVKAVDRQQSRLDTQGPVGPSLQFFHMDNWEPNPRYYLENHPALLTAPGQWYLDEGNGKLTYLPRDGETLDHLEVIAPVAQGLVHVAGDDEQPVRGLIFQGLHFEHAAWPIPEQGYAGVQATAHDRRDGSAWSFVPAALMFERAEQCGVEHGSIRRLGQAAIWFGSRCSNNRLVGNLIDDVSGNGIMIGETGSRQVDGRSWTAAAPAQAATANVIEDNMVQRCGRQFFGAVGIWVGLAADTEIRHNTVRQLPYTGVSVGWMWNPSPTPCRGTMIEANHIHDVMQVLSDGGGIYTLGWQPGAAIRENLIHGVPVNLGPAESNGMFIDEGSKGLLIERNVIYDTDRSPLRFHRAEENLVRSNVLVLPEGDTPVVRYNATPERNITLEDNHMPQRDAFDPVSVAELRRRGGPRTEHQDVPDPAGTFQKE